MTRPAGRGPAWLGAWLAVGAAFTLSFPGALTIGLFVLPFALVLLLIVVRRSPHLLEAIGLVSGTGVMLPLLAFRNRDYEPCSANGFQRLAPGQQSVSCGGWNPHPWLYLGIAVTAAGVLAYLAASRARP
jgi:hypothetical protein